jgi:tRNA (Thr-GGU) A37 N-methylase
MHVTYTLEPIGLIQREGERTWIEIAREHRPALLGLSGFSHIEVIWWCHYTDSEQARTTKQFSPPFDAPVMGVLASRAPMRPNPLATSTVPLLSVDVTTGVLALGEIDAFDLTPVNRHQALSPDVQPRAVTKGTEMGSRVAGMVTGEWHPSPAGSIPRLKCYENASLSGCSKIRRSR